MKDSKKTKRVAIYIDGSNFYYKLKDLEIKNLAYFSYGKFSKLLAREHQIVAKRYYVGIVRTKEGDAKSKRMQENQVRLFNHLRSGSEGFNIQRGYLMKNDGVYHEKGVDVKMAVDLLVGAYEDMYDVAILVSSDTDLIPAIQKVKQLGKKIEYIGFSHKPSYGLIKNVSETRLLTKEDVIVFEVLKNK
ncbi:MAG: NYN domain-containing protein [Parcubacteria group bacterium]